MQAPPPQDRPDDARAPAASAWPTARWVDLLFGLLFTALGCVIAALPDGAPSVGQWIAALAVGGLGLEALVAALRHRRSLASRIGPLP